MPRMLTSAFKTQLKGTTGTAFYKSDLSCGKADVPDSTHRLTKHWKWLTACHTLQPQVPVVGSVITKSTNTLPSNYIFDIFTSGALGNMSTHWKNNFSLMQLPLSHVEAGDA